MSALLHSVTLTRRVKADRGRVFDAFSTVEALEQWFSPSADIEIELKVFDFTPEGEIHLCYTMPDGATPSVRGRFELIERPTRIVLAWMWEAPDPQAGISTRVTIQLEDRGRETEIILTHDKLPHDGRNRHETGWEATLNRLGPFFASTSKH